MKEKIKIAVLVTCHNRRQKTLNFLESLVEQAFFKVANIDIYLLDDGSADGTAQAVNAMYPFIEIVTGTGSLFWARGMNTIWKYANAQKTYGLFLLFNDDVVLFDYALEKLFTNYKRVNKTGVILIGSTLSPISNKWSYGGYALYNLKHAKYLPVEPDDIKLIPCHLGNANVMLVDALTVERIGIFSDSYTHFEADFDYTLTAYRSGLAVLIAPGYYGYCENDHGVNWLPGNNSLKKRINYLYSPKGLAYKDYLFYIKKHFPKDYFPAAIKLWMKTFFPIIWDKFK